MGLWELVFEKQDSPAPHLADDEVEPSVVAKVAGDHGAAVTVAIRACQVADVDETLALDIQERALALVGAEVVALADNVPGVGDPEFAEGLVEGAGCRHQCSAVEGL